MWIVTLEKITQHEAASSFKKMTQQYYLSCLFIPLFQFIPFWSGFPILVHCQNFFFTAVNSEGIMHLRKNVFFLDLRVLFGKFVNFWDMRNHIFHHILLKSSIFNLLFLPIFAHFCSINAIRLNETWLK